MAANEKDLGAQLKELDDRIKKQEAEMENETNPVEKRSVRDYLTSLYREEVFLLQQQQAPKRIRIGEFIPIRKVSIVPSDETAGKVMNVSHFQDSGLAEEDLDEGDNRLLYIRKASVELWNELNVEKDRHKRRHVVVQGSPGTGKSSLVWAWCLWWAANNPDKRLRWIHFSRKGIAGVRIVDFLHGKYQRAIMQCWDYKSDAPEGLYHNEENPFAVVVVDGMHAEINMAPVHLVAYRKPERVILVASWQIWLDEDDIGRYRQYQMESWSLMDYEEACRDDDFYKSIVHNLDATEAEEEESSNDASNKSGHDDNQATRDKRIRAKFYYAGKSARWMFYYNTSKIIETTKAYCTWLGTNTGDVAAGNKEAVNYRSFSSSGQNTIPVSHFVGMWLLLNLKEDWVRVALRMADAMDNAAFDGWIFEVEFTRSLRLVALQNERSLETDQELVRRPLKVFKGQRKLSKEYWPIGKVTCFENEIEIESGLAENTWIIPTRYNQHCYNALQLLDFKKIAASSDDGPAAVATEGGQATDKSNSPATARRKRGRATNKYNSPATVAAKRGRATNNSDKVVEGKTSVILRVVQITVAKTHSLNFDYVTKVVGILRERGYVVRALDVVIVVPKENLATFGPGDITCIDVQTLQGVNITWNTTELRVRGFTRLDAT